jgi:hypothetical protein
VLWVSAAGTLLWLSLAPWKAVPAAAPSQTAGGNLAPQVAVNAALFAADEVAAEILSQPLASRLGAASATLIKLADQPKAAVDLARMLCRLDPEFVREHGSTLITVLAEAGSYDAALHFAVNGGPERARWLDLTFARWAEVDPRRAAEAALGRAEPDGLPIVCAVWSTRDPAGLATFLSELPAPAASAQAALERWTDRVELNPAAPGFRAFDQPIRDQPSSGPPDDSPGRAD